MISQSESSCNKVEKDEWSYCNEEQYTLIGFLQPLMIHLWRSHQTLLTLHLIFRAVFHSAEIFRTERKFLLLKATSHLTISMHGQRETGKIQSNDYHHGNCGPSLTGKTSSVSLIFTQWTHRNVKSR